MASCFKILRSFFADTTDSAVVRVEIALAIVFAATLFGSHQNVAAVFEWLIAFIFTLYVLTFFVDLLPAVRSSQQHTNEEMMHQREMANGPWGKPQGETAQNF